MSKSRDHDKKRMAGSPIGAGVFDSARLTRKLSRPSMKQPASRDHF